ncbi:MAG: hypothetical protein NT027_18905 [Proteobacteria bacterium]|nr:hypothetical protein [Pseudomonadota bacterium]
MIFLDAVRRFFFPSYLKDIRYFMKLLNIFKDSEDQGATLVETLAALALIGIAVAMSLTIYKNSFLARSYEIDFGNEDDLRTWASTHLKCVDLINWNAMRCTGTSSPAVLVDPGLVVSSNTSYADVNSRFKLSAKCQRDGAAYLFDFSYFDHNDKSRVEKSLSDVPTVCQKISNVNYNQCKGVPFMGRLGRYGICPVGSAVVIVNDGKSKDMSCCPLMDPSALLIGPGTRNIPRTGLCLSDEILTGMWNPSAGGYCSKVDVSRYKLSTPVIVKITDPLSPELRHIGTAYRNGDACFCPEGMISIGGHVPTNGYCADRCVNLIPR